MIQKIGKIFATLFLLCSFFSRLNAVSCTDWTLLVPPYRDGATMAFFDTPNKKQTILFGGQSNGQYVNDTWSWDGTKWTQLFPEHAPGGRVFAAMAFDQVSGKIILFGGNDGTNLADTWSWDGHDWTHETPGTSPSAREGASMAYDSINSQLILFGGAAGNTSFNDTYKWDGSDWILLTTTGTPPVRSNATMTFGPNFNQMILFGGFGSSGYLNDTWSWSSDGITTYTWTQVIADSTPGSPDKRSNAVMGYDPVNQQIILFGGQGNSGELNDTWSWSLVGINYVWSKIILANPPSARDSASFALDVNNNLILFGGINGPVFGDTWSWNGNNWNVLNNPPSLRSNASMVFDSTNLVLFGGVNSSSIYFDDTFNWNGNAWIKRSPTDHPSARAYASMAFDSTKVILFGGFDSSNNVLGDTLSWDGNDWHLLLSGPADSPPPRSDACMAYDPMTNQTILFGGYSSSNAPLYDTWSWNGTTWTQLFPANSPAARYDASLVFDSATKQLILFGGYDNVQNKVYNDTWTWNGTNWTELFPPTSPSVRAGAGVAFDQVINRLVLFGGYNLSSWVHDTWSWDGFTWSQISTADASNANGVNSMAFDPVSNQTVLFDALGFTWNFFSSFFVTATPSSEIICNGGTTSIVINANIPGGTFSWTASAVGVSGAMGGVGPLIAQPLSLTSSSSGTVIYTITSTSPTGCQGLPANVIVTVTPLPFSVAIPPLQTISSGQTATIALSSNVPGTTFSWRAISQGVSGASDGGGQTISQTLSTSNSTASTVTYLITPTNLTGCSAPPFVAVVTVEPNSSSNIFPPSDVRGFQRNFRKYKINVIKWQPPKSGEPPVSYRIYRHGLTQLVAVIPADQKLVFRERVRQSSRTYVYNLVSVDSMGNQSDPVKVIIKKKCDCKKKCECKKKDH